MIAFAPLSFDDAIKEARCTYVLTPYMKEPISLRPSGLTSWTFIVSYIVGVLSSFGRE